DLDPLQHCLAGAAVNQRALASDPEAVRGLLLAPHRLEPAPQRALIRPQGAGCGSNAPGLLDCRPYLVVGVGAALGHRLRATKSPLTVSGAGLLATMVVCPFMPCLR